MYTIKYRNKNGNLIVRFCDNVAKAVKKIEKNGGMVIEINRITKGEQYV